MKRRKTTYANGKKPVVEYFHDAKQPEKKSIKQSEKKADSGKS